MLYNPQGLITINKKGTGDKNKCDADFLMGIKVL